MILQSLIEFFSVPSNVLITISAILLSSVFFFLTKKKDISAKAKVAFIFLHLVLLIFPVYYFGLATNCRVPIINCNLQTIATFIPIGLAGLFMLGFYIAPLIFLGTNRKNRLNDLKINRFVDSNSRRFGIKAPKIYLLDTAKPVAYSLSNFSSIFISIGMLEILNKKELEAVLLHELGHIKQGSSLKKFSTMFVKAISPLSAFTSFGKELSEEEHGADSFAADAQKTWRFVNSAKAKVNEFNEFME